MEFEGKVVVVTGAARGMGARFSARFAEEGATVIGGDVTVDRLSSTADSINSTLHGPGKVFPRQLDVTQRESHRRLADSVLDQFGRIDHWVNNAGIFRGAPALEVEESQLDEVFGVNVNGVLFGAQAACNAMRETGGSIVGISSLGGYRARRNRTTYSVSKAAVIHLTRALALEFSDYGVRVNAVAPGMVHTEMTSWLLDNPVELANTIAEIPVGRLGQPDDIYNAVAFLLSDKASFITGATLLVDGGTRINGQ
jgi:3-oxoacyl-[acyl-carrier protein] reductase